MQSDFTSGLLEAALARRANLLNSSPHHAAGRLFNGFTEGDKDLVIDLFGRTAVIHDYSTGDTERRELSDYLCSRLDFLQAVLLKRRNSDDPALRNGVLLAGEKCDSFIVEHNVKYYRRSRRSPYADRDRR